MPLKQIHRARIELEELKSGIASTKAKDLNFREALKDPDTRPIYIRRQFVNLFLTASPNNDTRSSTTPVMDRNFHNCHQRIDEENAIWYEISRSRNAFSPQGM